MSTGKPITKAIKDEILDKVKTKGESVVEVAKSYEISPKTIYNWMTIGLDKQTSYPEVKKLKSEIRALTELCGKLAYELSRFKKK
jgi:transposase-like protein